MAAGSEAAASAPPQRTLIAGVGHRFWGDRSAGAVWVDRMAALPWPDHVVVDDYSFGAIAMAQKLQTEDFGRAIFVTAEERERPPATLHLRRHAGAGATPDHVQACIAEAGGGVVAIDLLLVIAEHFGALPPETWVLEVEPGDTGWGERLSAGVEALYPEALALLRRLADGGGTG